MALKTRAQLEAYFQTGDIPTQSQFAEVFESCVNITDDHFTKVNETNVEISFGFATADCSLGKSFKIIVTEDGATLDASNFVTGETYTFIFEQGAENNTINLRSATFKLSTPFVMPSTLDTHTILVAYAHNGLLYCQPQVDYPA